MTKSGPGFELTEEMSLMGLVEVKGSEVVVLQSKSMIKVYNALDMKLLWQKDSYSWGFPTIPHFTVEGCASPLQTEVDSSWQPNVDVSPKIARIQM
jgi:hypothetical protein